MGRRHCRDGLPVTEARRSYRKPVDVAGDGLPVGGVSEVAGVGSLGRFFQATRPCSRGRVACRRDFRGRGGGDVGQFGEALIAVSVQF